MCSAPGAIIGHVATYKEQHLDIMNTGSFVAERTFIFFLARRYVTLLCNAYVITSSQQTNVQRATDDVKRIFCKINEDFCQFKFNFVHKVCVFSFFFTYCTFLSSAQTWHHANMSV